MKADRIVLGIAVVIIGMVWLLVNLGVIPAAAAVNFGGMALCLFSGVCCCC